MIIASRTNWKAAERLKLFKGDTMREKNVFVPQQIIVKE